jgi:hypothetical protein
MSKNERVKKRDIPLGKRLNSIGAIRREMVRIYDQARTERIDSALASKLIWILVQLRDTIEIERIEPQLEKLEKLLAKGR